MSEKQTKMDTDMTSLRAENVRLNNVLQAVDVQLQRASDNPGYILSSNAQLVADEVLRLREENRQFHTVVDKAWAELRRLPLPPHDPSNTVDVAAGVVVNRAIKLMDEVNLLREKDETAKVLGRQIENIQAHLDRVNPLLRLNDKGVADSVGVVVTHNLNLMAENKRLQKVIDQADQQMRRCNDDDATIQSTGAVEVVEELLERRAASGLFMKAMRVVVKQLQGWHPDATVDNYATTLVEVMDSAIELRKENGLLRGIVETAAKHWLSLHPGVAWEGDVGDAMQIMVSELTKQREETRRLNEVIDKASKHWLSLHPGVAWEGDVGDAMEAAVREITKLRAVKNELQRTADELRTAINNLGAERDGYKDGHTRAQDLIIRQCTETNKLKIALDELREERDQLNSEITLTRQQLRPLLVHVMQANTPTRQIAKEVVIVVAELQGRIRKTESELKSNGDDLHYPKSVVCLVGSDLHGQKTRRIVADGLMVGRVVPVENTQVEVIDPDGTNHRRVSESPTTYAFRFGTGYIEHPPQRHHSADEAVTFWLSVIRAVKMPTNKLNEDDTLKRWYQRILDHALNMPKATPQ